MPAKKLLNLHILPAGPGDCAVIEYGEGEESALVVVDCGVTSTAKLLRNFLEARPLSKVELLVVSHVDSDHIAGAIKLLAHPEVARRVGDVWFNGLALPEPDEFGKQRPVVPSESDTEEFGFAQGDSLSERLKTLPHNVKFGLQDVAIVGTELPVKTLAFGAEVTLLSPSQEALNQLRAAWSQTKKIPNDTSAASQGQDEDGLEGSELDELEELGGAGDALTPTTFKTLLDVGFEADQSLKNGSSIAFVFEFGGVKLLMSADAHVSQLFAASKLLVKGAPYPVDVFKVSHHGSEKNVNDDLLAAFPSSRFVVSSNGKSHGHPTDVAIARIVHHAQGCEIIFNYRHATAERWCDFADVHKPPFKVSTPDAQSQITTLKLLIGQ